MTEHPKISVIIPVYNVAPYLRQCLDSVVRQTLREIEIICVDDGSTDGSPAILREYAAKDSRVKVIRQENGGVSAARNTGLAAVTGSWIGWADPDDWIEPDMFQYLLENAEACGADVAVCGRWEEYPNRRVQRGWAERQLCDRESALSLLLQNDRMQNFVWDKLWRRELFDGLTFWDKRTYEDIALLHRLFERAEKILCLPEAKYHYRQRGSSIVSNTSLGNRLNHFFAAKRRYEEMVGRWPQFSAMLEGQCVLSAIGIWCGYYQNPRGVRRQLRPQVKDIASFCAAHRRAAQSELRPGLAARLVIPLTGHAAWWAFLSAGLVGLLYKLKHGRAL